MALEWYTNLLSNGSHSVVKTLKCLVLNGVIFLGSIAAFHCAVSPGLEWLLTHSVRVWAGDTTADALQKAVVWAYNFLWLVPAYVTSLVVNCLWYNDIAKKTLAVHLEKKRPVERKQAHAAVPASVLLGQEVYRAALCAVYLAQSLAAAQIPFIARPLEAALLSWLYMLCSTTATRDDPSAAQMTRPVTLHAAMSGRVVEAVLLSWLYALYCFDYKWALLAYPLPLRLAFFQRNWAFFGGFGSVCVLASAALPFYVGAALMALLFPLFIIIACDVDPEERVQSVVSSRPGAVPTGSLPIFLPAELITAFLFRRLKSLLHLLKLVGTQQRTQ